MIGQYLEAVTTVHCELITPRVILGARLRPVNLRADGEGAQIDGANEVRTLPDLKACELYTKQAFD